MLQTKISCDFRFAFESATKEAKFPILPSNLDICKNFASKFHRIQKSSEIRLILVSFESSHENLKKSSK